MEKYVLIEVLEREISVPEFFDSKEEAHTKMCEYVAEAMDLTVAEVVESYLAGVELCDNACVLEDMAYCDRHGNNYDWKIFTVSIDDG